MVISKMGLTQRKKQVKLNQKTTEQFIKEVYELVKSEYSILGEYINSHTKILIKHNKCGNEFAMRPDAFLGKGSRCPICVRKKENLFDKIKEKYKCKFEILTPVIYSDTNVLIKCLICKNEYSILSPNLIYRIYSCRECNKIKISSRVKILKYKPRISRDTNYVSNEIRTLSNKEYELVGEYIACIKPISVRHTICGHVFSTRIHDFVDKGCRCPQCYIADKCKELGISIEEWGKDGDRNNRKLQKWGTKVKKRDSKKCVICGSNKNLNAHHLNGYHWDIENRDNVDNGVTLCEACHHGFHDIYGRGGNTKEQFKEFEKPKQLALTI